MPATAGASVARWMDDARQAPSRDGRAGVRLLLGGAWRARVARCMLCDGLSIEWANGYGRKHAPCSMDHAARSMQRSNNAAYNMQHATYNMQHATSNNAACNKPQSSMPHCGSPEAKPQRLRYRVHASHDPLVVEARPSPMRAEQRRAGCTQRCVVPTGRR